MIETLRAYAQRQMFFPGPAGIFVNPFWIARRGLAQAIGAFSHLLQGRLLDVGCGQKPYRELFRVDEYVGLEIDSDLARRIGIADVYYDGTKLPFADASFDSVLCNQVLEHVFTPDLFMEEIARVLRPSGAFLFSVPFIWDEHEQPWDYGRYTSFGLEALCERHGLAVTHRLKLVDDSALLFQLANAYLYKVIPGRLRRVACVLLMAPLTAIGYFAGHLLPSNPDMYLDQVVVGYRE